MRLIISWQRAHPSLNKPAGNESTHQINRHREEFMRIMPDVNNLLFGRFFRPIQHVLSLFLLISCGLSPDAHQGTHRPESRLSQTFPRVNLQPVLPDCPLTPDAHSRRCQHMGVVGDRPFITNKLFTFTKDLSVYTNSC